MSVRPFRPSLSMLGWALNEEMNIGDYVERAGALLASVSDDYELILIDDGSTDGTAEMMESMRGTRPWLRVHRNGRNRGPGYNTKKAIELSTKDYVFWQTVDWSYDVTTMMQNLHLLRGCDVLQGVRLGTFSLKGLLTRSDNVRKALISQFNYALIRTLFWLPLSDYQNVTVYPRRLIQGVRLESESSFTNPECLLQAWWRGAVIQEVPVPFIKREKGEAKGTRVKQLWMAICDVLGWWWHWVALGNAPARGRGRVIPWTPPQEGEGAGRAAA